MSTLWPTSTQPLEMAYTRNRLCTYFARVYVRRYHAARTPGRLVDGGKWQNMFLHNFESSVDTYATVWNHLFKIIGLCNTSIDKLTPFLEEHPDYTATSPSSVRCAPYTTTMPWTSLRKCLS
jgi:hypothetical protein